MDSWEFDDEDGDDGAASPAAAGDFDPFGDEDASSDGSGGAWDDSSDDEAEKLPKKGGGKKLGGKQKSGRELARAKKDKERQERRKALKAERMSLARAAGRNFEADAASAADGPSWRVMQMDEDGAARRTSRCAGASSAAPPASGATPRAAAGELPPPRPPRPGKPASWSPPAPRNGSTRGWC